MCREFHLDENRNETSFIPGFPGCTAQVIPNRSFVRLTQIRVGNSYLVPGNSDVLTDSGCLFLLPPGLGLKSDICYFLQRQVLGKNKSQASVDNFSPAIDPFAIWGHKCRPRALAMPASWVFMPVLKPYGTAWGWFILSFLFQAVQHSIPGPNGST